MCIVFTCGEHTFRKEVEGYGGVVCRCFNCGNYSARVIKTHPWFTLCFVVSLVLSFLRTYEILIFGSRYAHSFYCPRCARCPRFSAHVTLTPASFLAFICYLLTTSSPSYLSRSTATKTSLAKSATSLRLSSTARTSKPCATATEAAAEDLHPDQAGSPVFQCSRKITNRPMANNRGRMEACGIASQGVTGWSGIPVQFCFGFVFLSENMSSFSVAVSISFHLISWSLFKIICNAMSCACVKDTVNTYVLHDRFFTHEFIPPCSNLLFLFVHPQRPTGLRSACINRMTSFLPAVGGNRRL